MLMKEIQKEILENKKRHGFNTTSIETEFCYLYGELREAYEAYYKGLDTYGEEIADVTIFLMGVAEIKGIDLGSEILKRLTLSAVNALQQKGGITMVLHDARTGEDKQMIDIQKEIHENEIRKGFNVTNIEQKFCNIYGEVGEAYEAYYKQLPTFAEELADIAIYLMGLAEIQGIDLGAEIIRKVEINKGREYKRNELGYMVHL